MVELGRLPVYRNGLALAVNSTLSSALGLVYWAVAARLTSPSVLGRNASLVTAMTSLGNVAILGLASGIVAFVPSTSAAGSRRIIGRSYTIGAGAASLLALGFCLLAPAVTPAFDDLRRPSLAVAFMAGVAGWALFSLQDSALAGLGRSLIVPAENLVYAMVKLGVLLLLAGGVSGYGIFTSWALPAVIGLAPVNWLIFRRYLPRHDGGDAPVHPVRSLHSYVALETLGSALAVVGASFLPVIVVAGAGAVQGAHFYVPWLLASSLDLFAINFGLSLTVETARTGRETRAMLVDVLRRVFPLVAVAVGIGIGMAPILLQLFGGGFADASTVLRILLLSCLFRTVSSLGLAALRAELQSTKLVGIQAIGCLLVPVPAFAASRIYGPAGAAVVWTASQAVATLAVLYILGWLTSWPQLRAAKQG